jgi:small subunit ribosomal protein S6
MYIIPLKVGSDETTTVQEKVRTMLQSEGAKITNEIEMGKRKLAYPIKHIRHGSYVVIECNLEPTKVKNLNDWFRMSPEILRAQIVAKQLKSPEQMERERTFQEKLARLHAKAEEVVKPTPIKQEEIKEKKEAVSKVKVDLDDLDKKLEQILEEKVVK